MSQEPLKIELSHESSSENRNALNRVQETLTEELLFGICSPIGTRKKVVVEKLQELITNEYGYECVHIRLSDIIDKNLTEKIEKFEGGEQY
jgi:hypothetical protein